jgi:transposase-like protein
MKGSDNTDCAAVCGQSFNSEAVLKKHVRKVKHFKCSDCGRTFPNQDAVNQNMKNPGKKHSSI